MNPRKVLVIAICLAVPAAGCGSRARLPKAQYEQKVTDIGSRFTDTLEGIFSSPGLQTPPPSSQRRRRSVQAPTPFERPDELDGLGPPPDAEQAHGRLVDGFRPLAQDLDGFADDAQAGNLTKIQAFNQAVSSTSLPSMQKIQQALDDLKARGYHIGSPTASP